MKGFWRVLETTFAIAAIVVAWDLYTRYYDVPDFLLPSPVSVWNALVEAAKGPLFDHLLYTITILVLGYVVGVVLGIASGLVLAKSARLERWLSGPILF